MIVKTHFKKITTFAKFLPMNTLHMKTQKTIFLVGFLLLFLSSNAQTVVINEIITSNSTVNTDDDGSYEDWVELYNTGTESINLLGYGLSDNDNLFKWIFPDYSIQPGEHLLVWCSNKNRTDPGFPLHTNFAISAGGETITLTFPDGTIADQVPAIVIPQNFSYGRQPDGNTEFVVFQEPTPGNSNITQGYSSVLDSPHFSTESGFYDDSFYLTLSSSDSEATIIFTLDGSEPDENNLSGKTYSYKNQYPYSPGDVTGDFFYNTFTTHSYSEPILIADRSDEENKISAISTTYNFIPYSIPNISIQKATSIRAKTIKEGALSSPVVTHDFFVKNNSNHQYDLPVIAINIDEDRFFDYEHGIYVAGKDFDDWRTENPDEIPDGNAGANYNRSGQEWEVKANLNYFVNQNSVLNQNVGIRINGSQSRITPNKSMRIYARSEYGNDYLNYSFFEGNNFDFFKRLILRNSGGDTYLTMFRDAFIQESVKHLNFQTQSYQPSVVFINTEYWGIFNIRERFDDKYFNRVFGIETEDLDFLEAGGDVVSEGDNNHYMNMLGFIEENTLAEEENYEYIRTQMDIENYVDYFITNIFIANTDWPHNNIEFFRKRTSQYEPDAPYGQDGRWRWLLKDTDFGFNGAGGTNMESFNSLEYCSALVGFNNQTWSNFLFRNLLENENFKAYFITRFADLLNTTFLPNRLNDLITQMQNKIESEINSHSSRWNHIGSLEQWNTNVEVMKTFALQRPAYQRNHIQEKFNISENINTYLYVSNPEHGYIKINTIEILSTTPGVPENPYPWTGIYFKSIPITLKAIPKPGFVFSHWTGASNSSEDEITLVPETNFQLTAHFIPSEEAEEAPIYFWLVDNAVPNNTALTEINSSFEIPAEGLLRFESCLEGYPFNSAHPNWRKASMERRNSPTDLNYIPEANEDVPFESANMRGLQIKQPFQQNGLENQLIFEFSTSGYKDIVFGFAAKDENAADVILIDYSVSESIIWSTEGLITTSFDLSDEYQLYEVDFSSLEAVNGNPNFKIRLRFDGENMTQDNGDRVTFNNFSVKGMTETFDTSDYQYALQFNIYPNPVSNDLYIVHRYDQVDYKLFSIDGKLVQSGSVYGLKINISDLQNGIYILQLEADGKKEIKKIVKK